MSDRSFRQQLVDIELAVAKLQLTVQDQHKRNHERIDGLSLRIDVHDEMIQGNGNGWRGCKILLNQYAEFRAGLAAHFWALWTAIMAVGGAVISFYLTRPLP